MYCPKCGANLTEGTAFCPYCGERIPGTGTTYATGQQTSVYSFTPLKTDRNLWIYILLNIVTCGIYGLYFIYTLSRDINIVCREDGQNTAGLLAYFLLNFVTCGIYSWIWSYSFANRLYMNAPRYGMQFSENGTTVLMWDIFGMLICGIGPFIAMYIMIKNLNILSKAYNDKMDRTYSAH